MVAIAITTLSGRAAFDENVSVVPTNYLRPFFEPAARHTEKKNIRHSPHTFVHGNQLTKKNFKVVGGLSPALVCWRGVTAFAANFPSPRADLLALHHVCSMPLLLFSQDLLANSDITYWPSEESSRHLLGVFNLVYTRQLSHAYMLLSISQQFQVVSNHQVALFLFRIFNFLKFPIFFNSQDGALGAYHH